LVFVMNANDARRPHPIRDVLRAQGRSQAWLAYRVGRNPAYVRAAVAGIGRAGAGAGFRRACAEALGLPVHELFHAATSDGVSTLADDAPVAIGAPPYRDLRTSA
jgi:hypothetical protein